MRRIAELDGLRAIAAMVVVCFHVSNDAFPWGWAAVDVFFVLSGYLITVIVLEHGRARGFLRSFYIRRGLRIWPIYYLLLAVLALYWAPDSTGALPYYLTYTQEVPHYLSRKMPDWGPVKHTWTLALEEQFYLIWPPLIIWAGRRWAIPVAIAVATASMAIRFAGGNWWLLVARADGFALGGLLAAILNDPDPARGQKRAMIAAKVAGVVALGFLVHLGWIGVLGDDQVYQAEKATFASLASLALIALLIRFAGRPILAPLRLPPLTYLGTISYGIYLYHYPVYRSRYEIKSLFNLREGLFLWSIEVAQTLAIAALSWHYIEKRCLRLKDRVPYERSTDAT
jgi:peptidoglycan/LPS O-acetylase OafA/YrhL